MTSRERVKLVLDHKIPDRVPNGLGGCETAGLHVVAYDNLTRVLGVPYTPPRIDTFMTNAVFEESAIKAMDGDIILLASPNMCRSNLRSYSEDEWKDIDLWGRKIRVSKHEFFKTLDDGSIIWESCGGAVCPKGTYYFDHKGNTDLFAEFTAPDPDTFKPRDTIDERVLRHLEKAAKELYDNTDLSICLGESITDLQVAPGGLIGSMVLMMEEPEIMTALLEKCTEAALKQLSLLDEAVGKYVDILSIAHDFGDNRGVTIGDSLWREIYKPYYKKLFEGWKKRTSMHVNLHSCGAISAIIPDLIECGLEVLNPVQTSAANMSIDTLKADFGDKLVFWGGAYDAQLISEGASYDEVFKAVSSNIEKLKAGGGFIFSGVHNLPATLPDDHLRAMIDAYKAARDY